MLLNIELRLRPDERAPGEARKSLEALRRRLPDDLVDEAELLVSETVSNCVRHAELGRADAIQVRVRGSRSMLHVDVVDPGTGFDPTTLDPPDRRGGWGLWLVDRIASRWGMERGDVTRVWFELASRESWETDARTGRAPRVGGSSKDEMIDEAKGRRRGSAKGSMPRRGD